MTSQETMRPRAHVRAVLAMALLAVALIGASCAGEDPSRQDEEGAPVITSHGRWFVDHQGRVVQLRGVNEVYKSAPYYPAADGFGADDARFLSSHGFNTVRLGVNLVGLMPERGKIDETYLDGLATSVSDVADAGMYVVLDFHQDGYAPKYNGNGFPDWMAIDDGLENPPNAVFPLYYIQNPAMQRAWESFWANRAGADGVGVQEHFINALTAVVERFADERAVIGYETINEPFPGADWSPCLSSDGCEQSEQELLVPFANRVVAAVQAITTTQQIWIEPFVLFNFGQGPTSLVGPESDSLLAVHSYAVDEAGEKGVVDYAVAASERDGKPVLVTEFGASVDPDLLDRLADGFDRGMLSWLFWAYNENIMSDRSGEASIDRVNDIDGFRALVRPYPAALAGVPLNYTYDARTRVFELRYLTIGPDGSNYRDSLESVVFVPELIYDTGYEAEVSGGTITSQPCAQHLTIISDADVSEVVLHITPAGAGSCSGPGSQPPTP